jgi:FkbM family methyltransferase
MLIFDVGFYNGEDTRYYLAKGARVVAFEANPALVEAGERRFADAIGRRQLCLHNLAISQHSGPVEFFLNKENVEWSTAYKEAAQNWGEDRSDKIIVQGISGAQLYDRFGVPDYVKSDIEGLDIEVILPLTGLKVRPTFVSVEFSNPRSLVELQHAGYDSFKIIDQAKIPGSTTRIGNEDFTFLVSCSGPVSDEAQGEWLTFDNAFHLYTNIVGNPFGSKLPPGHGWDLHAAVGHQASTRAQLAFMRDLMDEYGARGTKPTSGLRAEVSEVSESYTQSIANDWKESAYYDGVESEGQHAIFWGSSSPFKTMFDQLDVTEVVEIACGHGRHLPQYADRIRKAYLVDINAENVAFCRQRHAALDDRVEFLQTGGRDLPGIAGRSCTAVFCYDAMVHFELFDIIGYLQEAARVLKPNGMALFHHSNWSGNPGGAATKSHDFGWRNYMTAGLFTHIASRTGFDVLDQRIISWGGWNSLDAITLIRKPA